MRYSPSDMELTKTEQTAFNSFMRGLKKRNPYETEFHQAVAEIGKSIIPFVLENRKYLDAQIFERMTEPDRIISFRVTWVDDQNQIRANRAWRVQFNHAIGPYKGGLRFHPSVDQGILKFLGFEQIFKNSLTGLPMGGGKGGSNFNPRGKSDLEVMRFCQSLMTELHRYIGEDIDIPAGDIGVGGREVSYLYGQYLRLENQFASSLTGKGQAFGGSPIRTEATGYGCVYFCQNMLHASGEDLKGKTVAISGSGNVAIYAAEKVLELGGKVLTLSDSGGFVHFPDGLTREQLEYVKDLKEKRRGRIQETSEVYKEVSFHAHERPWSVPVDIAMPCATQNELDLLDAEGLIKNGLKLVCEGANMPTTNEAVERLQAAGVLYAPGKASNAGGVAVSGLERTQNAQRLTWKREEVDEKLREIMEEIHAKCVLHGERDGKIDYARGANIGGFIKVADAMLAYGAV